MIVQEHQFHRFFSESVGRKNISPVEIIIRTNLTFTILGNRYIDYPKTANFNEKFKAGGRGNKKKPFQLTS